MPFRSHYWSTSRWATKILSRPGYATAPDWVAWEVAARRDHPFAFWFTETFLDAAQDTVYFPYDVYNSAKNYLYNRFVHRSHVLKTGLSVGQYHPVEERILHGMFTELVDFIEVENAKGGRSAENGLVHLAWEVSLGEESPRQSATAIELIRLYQWWTKERPARPDPYEASGWDSLARSADIFATINDEEHDAALKRLHDIENAYDTQDTDMLISLIRIRKDMWT